MAGTRAAARYAKAVLNWATSNKTDEAVNNDMKLVAQTILANKDLSDMLQSPVVRSSVKKAVLSEVFKNTSRETTSLIDTLIENKRIALFADVAEQYTFLYDQMRGMQTAKVTTAVPLSGDLENKVLAKVKELTNKAVEIENSVDESILGGFILRIGDVQYNASVANKLNTLKREFTLN